MDNNQDMRRILEGFNKLSTRKNINESTSIYECPPEPALSNPSMADSGQISITGDVGAISTMLSQLASIESSGATTNLPAMDNPDMPGVDSDPFDSDSDEGLIGNMAGSAAGAMAGTALAGPLGGAAGSVAGGAIGDKMTDEYSNAPDEDYQDTDYMTKDIAGGLNREKGAYADAEDGDNPMAVTEKNSYGSSSGEFYDDDLELTINWVYDDESYDEIEITAFDENDNEVELDSGQIRTYQEGIRDELQDAHDERGDHQMHQQQDDDQAREMAVEDIKARLYKALSEAKPDFLDMDKDGDKEEPMKKAAKDAKAGNKPKKGVNPFAKDAVKELSPATMKSYAKKASSSSHPKSASNMASKAGYALGKDPDSGSNAGEYDDRKSATRSKYIGKAIDKLARGK